MTSLSFRRFSASLSEYEMNGAFTFPLNQIPGFEEFDLAAFADLFNLIHEIVNMVFAKNVENSL